MLLIWVWNERVLSRTTPRLLTCREGQTEELSMGMVKLGVLVRVDLEPMRRTSVLSLLSFRKWKRKRKKGRAGCHPHNSGSG